MTDQALWMVVILVLFVAIACDAYANLRIIRLLEKEDTTEETGERKWHL